MNEEEQKKRKDTITILGGIAFIILSIAAIFIYEHFKMKALLKNGIHADAVITARYFEVNDKEDTSNYSVRMTTVPDTSGGKLGVGSTLNAYVKKASFYKYSEGAIVKVVYDKADPDHAKLVEEIE
ncbi:MAG: hypothetical protein U0U67_12550 [Chitinophagales bacterium]